MADVNVDAAESESQPKRKRSKPKGSGGGVVGTAVASIIAVAAVIMCVLLFTQLQALRKQLGEAGIEKPAGLGGTALAAENGGAGGAGGGENPYDWQDDPRTGILYPLGEFTANTADGKYARMELSLELSSGISSHDRQMYQVQQWNYEMLLEEYNKKLEKWKKDNKISSLLPEQAYASAAPRLMAAGLILLQHGAEGGGETGPPEMPMPPAEPRTVLEQELDDLKPRIRELIIDKINASTSDELTSADGKDSFKSAVIDGINELVKPYNGLVTGLIISDIVIA